jgi:hypothetical protein
MTASSSESKNQTLLPFIDHIILNYFEQNPPVLYLSTFTFKYTLET